MTRRSPCSTLSVTRIFIAPTFIACFTSLFYVFVKETSHRVSLLFLFYLFLCLFQSLPQ